MKRILLFLLLLPSVLAAQERGLLPVVPDLSYQYSPTGTQIMMTGAGTLLTLGSTTYPNGTLFLRQDNASWRWSCNNTYPTMRLGSGTTGNYWKFGINTDISGLTWDSTFVVMGGSAPANAGGGAQIYGGLSVIQNANFTNGVNVGKDLSVSNGTTTTKALVADSARTRVRVIDTTGFIILDSLKYKIVEYNEPYSLYRVDACCGGTDAAQSHRYGSVVIEMMVWQNGASYRTYTVRTDSANGVVCTGLAAEVVAMRSAGQGMFEGGGMSIAAVSVYRPSGGTTSVTGSGGPFTFMALPTGSAAYMPWRWWHNNNQNVYKMRITIGYAIPITSVSLNPVFFANS